MTATPSLNQQQAELARVRRMLTTLPEPGTGDAFTKQLPRATKKTDVYVSGCLLDPDRPVLPRWETTPYSGTKTFKFGTGDKSQLVDGGDGVGVSVGPKLKVRAIHWPRIGEVRLVEALEYEMLFRESTMLDRPRWEPVPEKTPVRPPLLPPTFPSDPAKARRLAAKGLGKAEDTLTLDDLIKWFSGSKGPEVAKL